MTRFLILICGLSIVSPLLASDWLKKLENRYAGMNHIKTDIIMTKQSPLLLQPATSEVELIFDRKSLIWHIKKPVVKKHVILLSQWHSSQGSQKSPLISVLMSIITGDLKSLQQDFNIHHIKSGIHMKLKDPTQFLDIKMLFHQNLDPKEFVFKMHRDTTVLQFKNFSSGVRP